MELNLMYKAVLDNMNEAVYARDLDKNLLYINPSSERLTGWPLEEALGKTCYEVFGDKDLLCKELCPVDKAISKKLHILHHEGKLKTRSGDIKDMKVSISPFYTGESIIGAVVVIEDVTRLKEVERTNIKNMIALEREIEERKHAEKALLGERDKLQDALAQIKTLSGMLPICASCKNIRDDKGYWKRIEAYIMEHSEAEFSHSICPECAKKIYPDFQIYEDE